MKIGLDTLRDLEFAQQFLAFLRKTRVRIVWTIGPFREQPPGTSPARAPRVRAHFHESENSTMLLSDSQQVDLSVAFKDKKGNVAAVENIQFATSDASILTVDQDTADPSKAVVKAVGPLGSGQVSVTADSLVGEGEAQIVGTLDIQVVAGQAVTAEVSTGTATEQP